MGNSSYLFLSQRLGFRNWRNEDIEPMSRISGDPKVMEYFPSVQSLEDTSNFIERMKKQYDRTGYCYFAVEELQSEKLVGFIGVCDQDWGSEYTPCIDIGWRLSPDFWGRGYATEGAKQVLEFALELSLGEIRSFAPKVNQNSINVMKKIGMRKMAEFKHPLLKDSRELEVCVCYSIG